MVKRLLGELELNRIYQRDCIEGMSLIPDKSIDMILCDLPYGTTACKWDTVIPFEPLWEQYERIIKDNGAIVLTASQPFTTSLIHSNIKRFRYCWVWDKKLSTNVLHAKKMPLKRHEDICVFYKKLPTYNPIMRKGKPRKKGKVSRSETNAKVNHRDDIKEYISDEYYPTSILEVSNAKMTGRVHPTQKPVDLFAYLIRTYTNEGGIVLDNCMGSGTTAIAAVRTGRNFIGFEREPEYVEIANKRLDNEISDKGGDSHRNS
jgi:site-specific DNA-methyltransferase (adenine-specific)